MSKPKIKTKEVVKKNVRTKTQPQPQPERKITTPDPLADLKQAYAAGNDTKALELGYKHLMTTPDDTNALKMVARMHNRQQNWPAANEAWTRLIALEPTNPEPHLQVARIANRNKQPQVAIKALEQVLALMPTHEEALVTRLNLLIAQGNNEQTIAAAHQLVDAGVRATVPLLKLAQTLFDKHQQFGDSLVVASLATRSDPENTDAVKLRAKILATILTDAIAAHLEQDTDTAAQHCREILRSMPQHERAAGILREIVRPALIEARAIYKSGTTEDAIRAFDSVLGIDPNHVESLRSLARLYAKAQDNTKAEAFWTRLEAIAPDELESTLQIARLRAKAGDSEGALLRYSKLARLTGTFTEEAITNRNRMAARVLRDAANKARDLALDEALRLTNVLLEIESPTENLPDVRNRIAVLSAREAAHAFKDQDHASAVAHAKRALIIDPANERALMLLARAGHKTQDYRSALQAWQKIAELQPSNVEAWLQQARYFNRFREYYNAVAASNRLLELDPSHEEASLIRESASMKAAANAQ